MFRRVCRVRARSLAEVATSTSVLSAVARGLGRSARRSLFLKVDFDEFLLIMQHQDKMHATEHGEERGAAKWWEGWLSIPKARVVMSR